MAKTGNQQSSSVAHFKGGRGQRSTDVENTASPPNRIIPSSFDDDLPEGVDFSEGGWATDFALSLVGLLFFISGLDHYKDNDKEHFLYLHAGTAVAHFFGGLAHRFYPNRASDGIGMTGFYVTMILGYGGNCLRFAMGWDLEGTYWPVLGVVAFSYLVVTGTWTICRMERTNQRLDASDVVGFKPDSIYAAGELAVAILEVAAGFVFLLEKSETDVFAVVAVVSNTVGWIAVYALGGFAFICGFDYDPGFMQRVFHLALIVMLWAINEYAITPNGDDEK